MNKTEELWQKLRRLSLVEGEMPANSLSSIPWYVKLLTVFSSWLASILILYLLSLGVYDLLDTTADYMVVGVLLVTTAFFILRLLQGDFFVNLGLVISLVGQGFLFYGIFRAYEWKYTLVWFLAILFNSLLVVGMNNFVHRVFSTVVAVICFFMLLLLQKINYFFTGLMMFACSWVWINEFKFLKFTQLLQPISYGLVLALLIVSGVSSVGLIMIKDAGSSEMSFFIGFWLNIFLGVVALIYTAGSFLKRYDMAFDNRLSIAVFIVAAFFGLLAIEIQGVTVGVLILLLGFSSSNRVLSGLGILSLLFFVSFYYYSLEVMLLYKSGLLLVSGLMLLVMRWLTIFLINPPQEELHNG